MTILERLQTYCKLFIKVKIIQKLIKIQYLVQSFKEMNGMHMIASKDKINYNNQKLKSLLVRQHVLVLQIQQKTFHVLFKMKMNTTKIKKKKKQEIKSV